MTERERFERISDVRVRFVECRESFADGCVLRNKWRDERGQV